MYLNNFLCKLHLIFLFLFNSLTEKNVRACEAAMLLASLCSTMERLPMAKVPAVATENSVLLQAYLTERAVQDSRMKQHQYKHKASVVEVRSGAMAPDISAAKENALGILAHTSDVRRQPISDLQINKPQAEFLPPSSCPSPSYVRSVSIFAQSISSFLRLPYLFQ